MPSGAHFDLSGSSSPLSASVFGLRGSFSGDFLLSPLALRLCDSVRCGCCDVDAIASCSVCCWVMAAVSAVVAIGLSSRAVVGWLTAANDWSMLVSRTGISVARRGRVASRFTLCASCDRLMTNSLSVFSKLLLSSSISAVDMPRLLTTVPSLVIALILLVNSLSIVGILGGSVFLRVCDACDVSLCCFIGGVLWVYAIWFGFVSACFAGCS